jgi:hypothetical protein
MDTQNISYSLGSFSIFKSITNIVYAIVIASGLVILITTGLTNQNAVIGLITSYGSILAAILLLLAWVFKYTIDTSYYNKLLLMLPFIVLIILVSMILTYLSVYFNRITSNKISDYYFLFSRLSALFLILQLFIIFSSVSNVNFAKTKSIENNTFAVLMLMATLNTIWVVSLGVILKYYSTDG